MTNTEVIKKAQETCGEYVTGYKRDVSQNTIREICKMMWTRAKNLSYNLAEWHVEVATVVGNRNYKFWFIDIMEYQAEMLNANKYYMFHGHRMCA